MVIHIALFAWKETVRSEEIEQLLLKVRELKLEVSGIREIFCGQNFSRWAEGFTHAVVVLADNEDALERYRRHPNHVEVARRIDEVESKSLGVDFFS